MKTLIVHPKDETTKFLTGIYSTLTNKTVITGGITKAELQKHFGTHDRVIMLGHGTPQGLLSVNQFSDFGSYVTDYSLVESLRNKVNNIYIWCDADQFVHRYSLQGFYTGMFISEVSEAWFYDFWDIDQDTIDKSNFGFSEVVSCYINERIDVLYKNVIVEYGALAMRNPIAQFYLKRLYVTISDLKMFLSESIYND